MGNLLKMAQIHTIETLWRQGWSCRRIARELGIYRDTVRKYVARFKAASKPANVTPGSPTSASPDPPKPATQVTPGSRPPTRSKCAPFVGVILDKLRLGLTAQRIYQDLKIEHGFSGGYQSVKRCVRKLLKIHPLPFRRMECAPGDQCQVDFGKGAWVDLGHGKRKRPWLFRIVLSHSRKAYSETVWRQTTELFIRCLENAFWAFGGVTTTISLDNLRAAVTRADWFDPELNPKIEAFARHYQTAFLPIRSYTPRHDGKVERGIGYAQENALAAKSFPSLTAENEYLQQWEATVADLRIHGTTKKQVKRQFDEVERAALKPLPQERFPFFHEGQRKVARDTHVEVDKAYYSAPPEYLGHTVWVRYDARLVRIFNLHMEQIALHTRVEPGRFSTHSAHIASEKISGVERGAEYLLGRIEGIGPNAVLWARAMLAERGIMGVRVLAGLLALWKRTGAGALDRACALALGHGIYRLRGLRELLRRPAQQENFEFMEKHPLIREMQEYGKFAPVSFRKEEGA